MFAGVNNRVGLAVGDSGAYMTVMDLQSAALYGLTVRRSVSGDCGSYAVPGGGVDRDYAGVVERPFELRLGGQVKFTLTGMRVIEHPFPLFLIGADILCGGKKEGSWNYTGCRLKTMPCGRVDGTVGFTRKLSSGAVEEEDCTLAQAATPRTVRDGGGLGSVASTFVAGTFRPQPKAPQDHESDSDEW